MLSFVSLLTPGFCRAKMKTNGSQSSHIQVDRQTIETALDDEVAETAASFANNGNESKTCSRVKRRKLNGKTTMPAAESEDLLDILDNFLITTSSNAESSSEPQQQFSSHPRSESITNVSTPAQQQPSPSKRFEMVGAVIRFHNVKSSSQRNASKMFCVKIWGAF